MRVGRFAAGLCLALGIVSPAHAEEGRVEAIVNPAGGSLSQDPRVINFASPMVELRTTAYFDSKNNWLAADTGFAILVFPEKVFELRAAARLYPWRLLDVGWLRESFYIRPGFHSLLVIDGFDGGPDLELGLAPSVRGVSFIGGLSFAGYLREPRIVAEVRFGVGLTF